MELVSGEPSPAKIENLAARSIKAGFVGKVRPELKGCWTRASPEMAAGVGVELASGERWRSSMAWVGGSSRSAVKELAFSGGTAMSRWISSRNWRDSNSGPGKMDPGTVAPVGSMGCWEIGRQIEPKQSSIPS